MPRKKLKTAIEPTIETLETFTLRRNGDLIQKGTRRAVMAEFHRLIRLEPKVKYKFEYIGKSK
jgi:hypothetical protein